MVKSFLTRTPFQTKKLGEILAKEIMKIKSNKKALVIGLEGDLGGGKTTFLQGFAKGLGVRDKILSPTFVIFRKFLLKNNFSFYHFDCYRIQKAKEVLSLDFKKIISDPRNIVTIEWADRIKRILPKGTLILKFIFLGENIRRIFIQSDNG